MKVRQQKQTTKSINNSLLIQSEVNKDLFSIAELIPRIIRKS